MYLGVDVGGTKVLLAVFSADGQIVKELRFETPKNYDLFLSELKKHINELGIEHYRGICCAIPGRIDREHGVGQDFGNLPWHDVAIKKDLEKLSGRAPVWVENDSNLAGLHEGILFRDKYKKVLYITIGTGIGDGIIIDGVIDPNFADSESGQMMLDYGGQLKRWEDIASGRAMVKRYGRPGSQIDDPKIWRQYAKDLSLGLVELIAVMQPDVIIIGGGIGTHFDKYGEFLRAELKRHENTLVPIPPVIQAKKPEEAVIYGCFDFIKQNSR